MSLGRVSFDDWAMGLAVLTSKRSTCLRRQVGCVLLSERGHVLATGYNGVARGQLHCNEGVLEHGPPTGKRQDGIFGGRRLMFPHACPGAHAESGTNLDGCHAIHAEQNALLQCRSPYEIETCFCTASPCMTCMKLLLNTSCKKIFYLEGYPHGHAIQLWQDAGREITHLETYHGP